MWLSRSCPHPCPAVAAPRCEGSRRNKYELPGKQEVGVCLFISGGGGGGGEGNSLSPLVLPLSLYFILSLPSLPLSSHLFFATISSSSSPFLAFPLLQSFTLLPALLNFPLGRIPYSPFSLPTSLPFLSFFPSLTLLSTASFSAFFPPFLLPLPFFPHPRSLVIPPPPLMPKRNPHLPFNTVHGVRRCILPRFVPRPLTPHDTTTSTTR